jgi:hypothetical protein
MVWYAYVYPVLFTPFHIQLDINLVPLSTFILSGNTTLNGAYQQ